MGELNGQDPSLELVVRQGITTGEAVVAPGSGPRIGESVIGDVVNTAARLQTAADPGTILVGEPTYGLTASAVLYEPAEEVLAKGKREALTVWRPVAIHHRLSSSERAPVVSFVGRRRELH